MMMQMSTAALMTACALATTVNETELAGVIKAGADFGHTLIGTGADQVLAKEITLSLTALGDNTIPGYDGYYAFTCFKETSATKFDCAYARFRGDTSGGVTSYETELYLKL